MTRLPDIQRHYAPPVVLSWPELIDQWEKSRPHVAYDPRWGQSRILNLIRRVVR